MDRCQKPMQCEIEPAVSTARWRSHCCLASGTVEERLNNESILREVPLVGVRSLDQGRVTGARFRMNCFSLAKQAPPAPPMMGVSRPIGLTTTNWLATSPRSQLFV